MVNYELNWRNTRPRIKIEKAPKSGAKIEAVYGLNCIKFKDWNQSGV